MPEAASTLDVERQLLPSLPHSLLSHFSEFPFSGETAYMKPITFILKQTRSLQAAGISPGTAAGRSWGRPEWPGWL